MSRPLSEVAKELDAEYKENPSDKNVKKLHATLAWAVLEHKCIYYVLNGHHPWNISDFEYDLLEKKYESLCHSLEEEPTASNMVDFDIKRPVCWQVRHKIYKTLFLDGMFKTAPSDIKRSIKKYFKYYPLDEKASPKEKVKAKRPTKPRLARRVHAKT